MNQGINRKQAIELLHKYIKNPNMIKHCFATEVVMRDLAKYSNEDEEKWAMAGLLHDLDVELTHADLNIHGQETVKILRELSLDDEIIDAIECHNELSAKKERKTKFHHALAAGETITGLIIATTLVYPDKKLASVKSQSILKRMKEKSFAASVNRDTIRECEVIGIPLNQFAEICLHAMQSISADLGL
jgi:putative nucleotidyltransferase with HDIG domain